MILFIRTFLLLAVVTSVTSESSVNNKQHGFARFYEDAVQVFQPVTIEPYLSETDGEHSIDYYRFVFNRADFLRIKPNSIQLLNTDVIERTFVFHQRPNFEVNGTRYLYRPKHRVNNPIEVELVDAKNKIFRQLQRPYHFLYSPSLRFIESINQVPIRSYTEVEFICKSLTSKDNVTKTLMLTYIYESVRWTVRYSLELPSADSDQQPELYAHADIQNNGKLPITFKEAEFFTGKCLWKNFQILPGKIFRERQEFPEILSALPLSENTIHQNAYVSYGPKFVSKLSIPVSVTLLPNSPKTIKLSKVNVTIELFLRYFFTFSPAPSHGKLTRVCNITLNDDFMPDGPLTIIEQGKFISEERIRNLKKGETCTIFVGYADGFSYERKVIRSEFAKIFNLMTYTVEYVFTNHKSTPNTRLHFTECFRPSSIYFNTKIALISNNTLVSDLNHQNECLQGYINISDEPNQTVIRYNLTTSPSHQLSFPVLDY